MIRKLISIGLFLIIFIILIHQSVIGQELIPKPGISCGVGTTEESIDITKEENFPYRCCYSLLENWDLKSAIKNSFEDTPLLLKNTFSVLIDFISDRIYNFPFIFWPFPGNPPATVGLLVDAIKSAYGDKRCEPGLEMVGRLGDNCFCRVTSNLKNLQPFCENLNSDSEKTRCFNCIGYNSETKKFTEKGGVYTAIGCIPGNLGNFLKERVFGWGVGLAGVIALFCIIYAAFQLQTSQGSPEKIKKAQELLTSCIMGLMLIIFSVFILKLIGVDILKIPGFGR